MQMEAGRQGEDWLVLRAPEFSPSWTEAVVDVGELEGVVHAGYWLELWVSICCRNCTSHRQVWCC
jgi:hypothetical protein